MPIILDCDPGVDDVVELIQIIQCRLPLKMVSTVAGNVSLDATTANALWVLEELGSNLEVHAGASRPLVRDPVTATHVHGDDGVGGARGTRMPQRQAASYDAIGATYKKLIESRGATSIFASGPLTNIATLFSRYPDAPDHVDRLIIMGGGLQNGNIGKGAEFNFYVDPEAADIVLSARPVELVTLDATVSFRLNKATLSRLASASDEGTRLARSLFRHRMAPDKSGLSEGLHDVCLPLYWVYPHDFHGNYLQLKVSLTTDDRGKLAESKAGPVHRVITSCNNEQLYRRLLPAP